MPVWIADLPIERDLVLIPVHTAAAVLVQHPPEPPGIVAWSGEPGGPSDVVLADDLRARSDEIAAKHPGIAPIVVVPDRLGAYRGIPMCVDSRLGDVATSVADDVRDRILHHLPVATGRRSWTVACPDVAHHRQTGAAGLARGLDVLTSWCRLP